MSAVDVSNVSYRYHRRVALSGLDLQVPEGSLYALLGPNGAGKTTLLQILVGLRRAQSGEARVLGIDSRALTAQDREQIGYVAEGQSLPEWMRLAELEQFLAPLYSNWDASLADALRERFELDPKQRVGTLSRGEKMKAALLCALAPRPKLLIMDEPFTGMDPAVKDELVRGLLESASSEGWTVLLSSHDIGELEMLADHVGVLKTGRMILSESMDSVRQRFKHVEVSLNGNGLGLTETPNDWLAIERGGSRLSFLVTRADQFPDRAIAARLPHASHIDVRDATLREIFIALTKPSSARTQSEVAA